MGLVKGYFNFYLKKKVKTKEELRKLAKRKRMLSKRKRRISIRKRSISKGLSAKKIFLAKGDLKHTSSKAVVTLYFYNTEKKFLLRNIKKQIFDIYRPKKRLKRYINMDRIKMKEIISYNRPFSLKEYMGKHDHYTDYTTSFKTSFIERLVQYFYLTNKYFNRLSNLVETKALNQDEQLFVFNKKSLSFYNIKYPNYEDYMHKVKLHYLKKLTLYLKLLALNQIKFKHAFLLKLRYLVSHIYNKNIEFNLVNLKKMHLNSDIFTQVVSLKLKNRNNKLYRVLRSSLRKVKIRSISRIKEKYFYRNEPSKQQLFFNKIRNFKINSIFALDFSSFSLVSNMKNKGCSASQGTGKRKKDFFNRLLLNTFPFFPFRDAAYLLDGPIIQQAFLSLQNLDKDEYNNILYLEPSD